MLWFILLDQIKDAFRDIEDNIRKEILDVILCDRRQWHLNRWARAILIPCADREWLTALTLNDLRSAAVIALHPHESAHLILCVASIKSTGLWQDRSCSLIGGRLRRLDNRH